MVVVHGSSLNWSNSSQFSFSKYLYVYYYRRFYFLNLFGCFAQTFVWDPQIHTSSDWQYHELFIVYCIIQWQWILGIKLATFQPLGWCPQHTMFSCQQAWKISTEFSGFLTTCCAYMHILHVHTFSVTLYSKMSTYFWSWVTVYQIIRGFLSYARILWQFVCSVWGSNQQPSNLRNLDSKKPTLVSPVVLKK